MKTPSRNVILVIIAIVVLVAIGALLNADSGKSGRSVIPKPAPAAVAPAQDDRSPEHFFLPASYEQRYENIYDPEPAAAEAIQSWQYLVYNFAKYMLKTYPTQFTRVIDIGCGSGAKLAAMKDMVDELVCIDFGENLKAVREMFPFMRTVEIDLNTDLRKLFTPDELRGALLINADNIEHVHKADQLLGVFKFWMRNTPTLL